MPDKSRLRGKLYFRFITPLSSLLRSVGEQRPNLSNISLDLIMSMNKKIIPHFVAIHRK